MSKPIVQFLRNLSRALAAFVLICSAIALFALVSDALPEFVHWFGGKSSLPKSNTLVCTMLLSSAILLNVWQKKNLRLEGASILICSVVALIGTLTVIEYATGVNFGIDQLIPTGYSSPASLYPGRPGVSALLAIMLLTVSVAFANNDKRATLSQSVAAASGWIALLAIAGYSYGLPSLYTIFQLNETALITAILALGLSLSAILMRPDIGPAAILGSTGLGGNLARRMLLLSLMFPGLGLLGGPENVEHDLLLLVIAVSALLPIIAATGAWSVETAEREKAGQLVIYSISKVLSRREPLDETIPICLKILCEQFGWTVGEFWQPTATGEELRCAAFYSSDDVSPFREVSESITFGKGVGLPGRVWETKNSAWINDVVADGNFPRAAQAKRAKLHGAFAFPIMSGDDFLGVFAFFGDTVHRPDSRTIRVLDLVATEIGHLIENKRMELLLFESEQRFKAIFDHTFELIGLLSPDGTLLEGNRTALTFVNVTREEVIGKPFWDTPWWSHSTKLQAQLRAAIKSAAAGEFVRFETFHPTPAGEQVAVDFSISPVTDKDGNVIMLIPEGRDISHKKEAERRVSEFYSTVSHELRTPLTSIRGALGLLEGGKAGDLSPRGKQLVTMGRMECERLVRLINDILDIRKIEAGKLDLRVEEVELNQIVEQSIEALKHYTTDNNITLKIDSQCDVRLRADHDRIMQVITNLTSNAMKFSPRDGTVTISTEMLETSAVKISVADSGPGISQADQQKLFQLFHQVDSSDSRPKGGTGLGLAISKALVEQHGGTIGVHSVPDQGSTFWFTLPAGQLAAKTNITRTPSGRIHAFQQRSPGPARVLIVEDDISTREVIKQQLGTLSVSVEEAATVEVAVTKAHEWKPDLVVLDLSLPDVDGIEFVKDLRKQPSLRNTPLIVYTARDLSEADKTTLTLGATAYLTKATTSEELFLDTVGTLLGELLKRQP